MRICVQVNATGGCRVELDKYGIGHTVPGTVEGCLLQQTTLNDPASHFVARLDGTTSSQQRQHFVEVAGRHRPDERYMARKISDDLERLLLTGPAVVTKILLDELEPLRDACRHRRLDAVPVPLELVDDESRDEQLDLSLVGKHPQGDDPSLSIPALAQVKPGGGVNEQVQHDTTVWAPVAPCVPPRGISSLRNPLVNLVPCRVQWKLGTR